jgi:two-component system cell cycle response regulator DivK
MKRILVVEDTEDNRRIIRDLLTSAGYEMIEAVTGKEDVTIAAEPRQPEVIGSDLTRESLSGIL